MQCSRFHGAGLNSPALPVMMVPGCIRRQRVVSLTARVRDAAADKAAREIMVGVVVTTCVAVFAVVVGIGAALIA